jgi:predicted nucleic-acid-binding protein
LLSKLTGYASSALLSLLGLLLTPHEILGAVERMLQTDVLVVENEQEVFTAMIALKDGHRSFADAVIAALGARMGYSYTLTFGRKALRLAGFKLA